MGASSSSRSTLEGREGRLQRLLLAWYLHDARSLPWRETDDPYETLVAEVMLQQTQASRVEPAFRAFLERFPTVEALAEAPLADVLRQWAGLGYNRRAVNLHRAAQTIVERHGGVVPDDYAALTALEGVGAYTARAVLAFAYGQDVAPVDANVARVLLRAASGRPQSRSQLQRLADRMVPAHEGPRWSQALMDLAARYCTPRDPRCHACPVAAACAWRMTHHRALGGGDEGPPDPAATSPARSRAQPPFAGSDRYHRGRLVDALRHGPVDGDELARAADCDDPGRLAELTRGLERDGLAEWSGGALRLPAER